MKMMYIIPYNITEKYENFTKTYFLKKLMLLNYYIVQKKKKKKRESREKIIVLYNFYAYIKYDFINALLHYNFN